jgi:hypothetical protein
MATSVCNPKVGTLVYRKGSPQLPGKVLGVKPADALGCHQTHVLWLNGEESQISDNLLRDFNALIADHKKTLDAHKARHDKLEKL